ncbi:LCP family protein [Paenibacillus sp. MSJ-34]|uniref:LCP family glycopolymer transferase n=1 Tax=Paenibacillus sp. MSJ-34 TaxID=2841529 RepID=UPI001C10FB88|nr:LCP family protein [Paenibacillus sp. MSJ-34]MBU5443462.1 LCP family protein [Paenibacillus sp. MSJ-34]
MRRWMKIAACIGVGLLLLAGGTMLYAYISVKQTVDRMYEALPNRPQSPLRAQASDNPVPVRGQGEADAMPGNAAEMDGEELQPFSLLLLGVDEREQDVGRADTIVFATVNPAKRSVLLVSIPRDTRVEIAGKGTVDKINHSYAFGGTAMSVETVERLLDAPVDYYVKTNMEGFAEIVDQLGGVEVDNAFYFDHDGYVFEKGKNVLGGEAALAYARMRSDDPRGDVGRTLRQQQLLKGLFDSLRDIANIGDLPGILDILKNDVKTNLTWDRIKTLFMKYKPHRYEFHHEVVNGKGKMIDRIYYYIVDSQEKSRIHDLIVDQLT